jgi:hypothetical protein
MLSDLENEAGGVSVRLQADYSICDLLFRRRRATSHIVGWKAGTLLRQVEIQQLGTVFDIGSALNIETKRLALDG